MRHSVDVTVNVQRPRCPYCHEDVTPGEGQGCAECMGWAHDECWDEHGKCPACGAARALPSGAGPPTAAETPEEIADRAAKGASEKGSKLILAGLLVAVLLGTLATLVASLIGQ